MLARVRSNDDSCQRLRNWLHSQRSKEDLGIGEGLKEEDVESERLLEYMKSAIWTFRSSVNSRKLWPGVTAYEASMFAQATNKSLETKRLLAGLWRVMCPYVVEYCERRKLDMWQSLAKVTNKQPCAI